MSSLHAISNIPASVLLASLEEYNTYLCRWQAHTELESRELHSLRNKIAELETKNEDIRDSQVILQRVADTQEALIASLEGDVAQARTKYQFSLCANGSTNICTMSPPVITSGSADPNCHPAGTSLPTAEPSQQPLQHRGVTYNNTGSASSEHEETSSG